MNLTCVEGPEESPVTLDEAKAQVRVLNTDDDDGRLQMHIDAAVAWLDGAEGVLGRAMVEQTWDLLLDDGFPSGDLVVPLPPLQEVESITYTDDTGEHTLAADEYTVLGQRLRSVDGWPSAETVTVRFVAGTAAVDVPAALKQAILLKAEELYDGHTENSEAIARLIRSFRRIRS